MVYEIVYFDFTAGLELKTYEAAKIRCVVKENDTKKGKICGLGILKMEDVKLRFKDARCTQTATRYSGIMAEEEGGNEQSRLDVGAAQLYITDLHAKTRGSAVTKMRRASVSQHRADTEFYSSFQR